LIHRLADLNDITLREQLGRLVASYSSATAPIGDW